MRGLVEVIESDEDLTGGLVAADFKNVGGPERGAGKVVSGNGYGVV